MKFDDNLLRNNRNNLRTWKPWEFSSAVSSSSVWIDRIIFDLRFWSAPHPYVAISTKALSNSDWVSSIRGLPALRFLKQNFSATSGWLIRISAKTSRSCCLFRCCRGWPRILLFSFACCSPKTNFNFLTAQVLHLKQSHSIFYSPRTRFRCLGLQFLILIDPVAVLEMKQWL